MANAFAAKLKDVGGGTLAAALLTAAALWPAPSSAGTDAVWTMEQHR